MATLKKNGVALTATDKSDVIAGLGLSQVVTVDPVTGVAGLNPDAAKIGVATGISFPLEIPTYDGLPSVTHPDVLMVPGGWNGWTYWMSYTPYPGGSRENACIVVSNDKVNWQVPAGLTNPIITQSAVVAAGYSTGSDTEIVINPDKSQMILFHRPYGVNGEGIWRTTSSDGVAWSTPTQVLSTVVNTGIGEKFKILSPAIYYDPAGVMWMYSVNDSVASASRLERRYSNDHGVSWSAAETCSFPAFSGGYAGHDLWHVNANYVSGRVHILANSEGPGGALGYKNTRRLFYWSSSDGLTFTGDSATPCIPLTGYSFDNGHGHYRSAMLPVPGEPLRWDVWVCGIDDSDPVLTTSAVWRLGFFASVDLAQKSLLAQRVTTVESSVSVGALQRVWIPASAFVSSLGSPSTALAGGRFNVWQLDASANEQINAVFESPTAWDIYDVSLYWTNMSTGAGDVQFALTISSAIAGGSLSTGDSGKSLTLTAPASGVLAVSKMTVSSGYAKSSGISHVRITRNSSLAGDTLPNDIGVLGLMLTKRT